MMEDKAYHDYDTDILHVKVLKAYMTVGRRFGWQGSPAGVGLKTADVNRAIKNNCTLGVQLVQPKNKTYYITPSKIIAFMSSNKTEGANGTHDITYIPLKLLDVENLARTEPIANE